MIDEGLKQHLEGPHPSNLATSAGGVPALARAIGLRVESPEVVRLMTMSAAAGWALASARTNPQIAVTVTALDCFRSVQLKGRLLEVTTPDEGDREAAERALEGFRALVEQLDPARSLSNLAVDIDMVVRVAVERVFDQTPGPRAGALLHAIRAAARPATFRMTPSTREPRMAQALERPRAFDGSAPPILVTVDAGGMPNVIHVSKVDVLDDRHVALSRQFFRKTAENLSRNPRALIVVIDPETNRNYMLDVRHVRAETSGRVFERLRDEIDTIASFMGATDVFRLEAADIFEVLGEREIDAMVRES